MLKVLLAREQRAENFNLRERETDRQTGRQADRDRQKEADIQSQRYRERYGVKDPNKEINRVHAKGVVLAERACFCLLSTF